MRQRLKRLTLIITVTVILSIQWPAIPHCFQNQPPGFNGITCQAPRSSIKNIYLTAKYNGLELYARDKDTPTPGNATLTGILYAFQKDSFVGAAILFQNFTNFLAIRNHLAAQHGQPLRINVFLEEYLWPGNKITIVLDYTDSTKEGRLFYSCQ